jgi:hypothetical protein
MRLYAPGSGQLVTTIADPADNGLPYYEASFAAPFSPQTLVWEAHSTTLSRLKVWTPEGGARDLVSVGSDTSQGDGDVGSDGHDLVWMHGTGTTNIGDYTSAAIMTRPLATDSAHLAPRRLRSELGRGLSSSPFVVGCGYAARANGTGIRVVRLADGVSWYLAASSQFAWRWVRPNAITCTELFAQAEDRTAEGRPPAIIFARVRLDSLGAGTPPD